MTTHGNTPETHDAEAGARGGPSDPAQRAAERQRRRNPLLTLLALLILPLSLGLALLMGIVALVVALRRRIGRSGASRS